MRQFFHSVTLDSEKCKGCINCMKRCPTEAIRVRNGKAFIITERCIDCGECIRVCPHHAKLPIYDSLTILKQFRYTIALPAPAFYGQFHNLDDIDILLGALKKLGFDEVFEVSAAAELVSDATRKMMAELPRPVISSACPAVTRLIRVRFPHLIDKVLPLNAPVEIAARMGKRAAMKKTGLKEEEIGVIFISPCPAKVTASKMPLGTEHSYIDGVLAISDVYVHVLPLMKEVAAGPHEALSTSGKIGISWGTSGGEAAGMLSDNYLAADGVLNVIKVLEDLEDDKINDVDFIELNACSGGCVGGVLTVENPYVAKARLGKLRKYLPVSCNHLEGSIPHLAQFDTPLEFAPVLKLDDNLMQAFEKMSDMERIAASLPGLDCGSCGAPSCQALAEDVVRGLASVEDCIFQLKEHMQSQKLDEYIPAPFRTGSEEKGEGD